MKQLLATVLALTAASASSVAAAGDDYQADAVVYGGNPAGVTAAVALSRAGCRAIVVEPRLHIGGLMSGGLSKTDIGPRPDLFSGLALEYFKRSNAIYGSEWNPKNRVCYQVAPSVAEKTFNAMLADSNIRVFKNGRLASAETVDGRIRSFTTVDGRRFRGEYFIDASYEGDLMVKAGVSYTWGREGADDFDESHAGFQPSPLRPRTAAFMKAAHSSYVHGTPTKISPYMPDGSLLPGIYINDEPWPKRGTGDKRMMGNGYRLSVTNYLKNLVPWPKPDNYHPEHYELVLRMIEAFPDVRFERFVRFGSISRENKFDGNNIGSIISTNHIGMNYDYPEGDWATRDRIWQEHEDWQKGLCYFLANDPKVPQRIRKEAAKWGLCKDEFVDNGHWPYHLYTREVRRMRGRYIMTENDIMKVSPKSDSICMGAFILDSHAVQRLVHPGEDPNDKSDDYIIDEGNYDVGHPPFQIPYRSITPKEEECENLLVPVCISATHVALGAIRMEPQYMMMGHAAGVAAAMAIDAKVAVQRIDTDALQSKLREQKVVLEVK